MSTDSVSPYRSSAVRTRRRGWPIACARLLCICVCASSTVVVVITEDAAVPVGEAGDCDRCWGLPPVVGPLLLPLFAAAAVRRTVTRRQWNAGKKSVFRSGSWRLNKS